MTGISREEERVPGWRNLGDIVWYVESGICIAGGFLLRRRGRRAGWRGIWECVLVAVHFVSCQYLLI